jgi:predicted SnoaL-like aldol condensation-catalyzing enzyme
MKTHKDMAVHFEQLIIDGQVGTAFEHYAGPDFRHHNPWFEGDRASLLRAMEDNAVRFPDKEYEVRLVLEDGNFVVIHSRLKPAAGMPDISVVHIYRFDGDRIAEEWDLGQPVPADSPNKLGMF